MAKAGDAMNSTKNERQSGARFRMGHLVRTPGTTVCPASTTTGRFWVTRPSSPFLRCPLLLRTRLRRRFIKSCPHSKISIPAMAPVQEPQQTLDQAVPLRPLPFLPSPLPRTLLTPLSPSTAGIVTEQPTIDQMSSQPQAQQPMRIQGGGAARACMSVLGLALPLLRPCR